MIKTTSKHISSVISKLFIFSIIIKSSLCNSFIASINSSKNINDFNIDGQIDYINIGKTNNIIIKNTSLSKKEIQNLDFIIDVENNEDMHIDPILNVQNILSNTNTYQWGIDRIDQEELPLNNNFNYTYQGTNVDVYILDTGLKKDHIEFQNRISKGYNFVNNNNNTDDIHGHGTHVASTVIGKNVGVSKNATVIPVKVLSDSGSGSTSGIMKAINWVVQESKDKNKCSIISMSLGGSKSSIFNNVINAAVDEGVIVVASAGNNNGNSCYKSPASAEKAITVGSTDINDKRSSFSNYGQCVDIYAPGSSILGAYNFGTKFYVKKSGTSMSCPHVAGVMAMLVEKYGCLDIPFLIKELKGISVNDKIKDIPKGTLNKFLQIPKLGFNHTFSPTKFPTKFPTPYPTKFPTKFPTPYPTKFPTFYPTKFPNECSIICPTSLPTSLPTLSRTSLPTLSPTSLPTSLPTLNPTSLTTSLPTLNPTSLTTSLPTLSPTSLPTSLPTLNPTSLPTLSPTSYPTEFPTSYPTEFPTSYPTEVCWRQCRKQQSQYNCRIIMCNCRWSRQNKNCRIKK